MTSIAIWQVTDSAPRRLQGSTVSFEAHLEDWIDQDPNLVQSGLRIIGRQVQVAAGRVDLLALDPQGRWCVIEVKRDRVDRATVAQVQDYAACLTEMTEVELRAALKSSLATREINLDEELRIRDALDSLNPKERQVAMFVVGTARAPGLERMLRFLSERHDVPIFPVLFNVFATASGEHMLVRDIDAEIAQPPIEVRPAVPIDTIRAETGDLVEIFDVIAAAADANGIRARPWKRSVMFAPARDGRRCLFTVWSTPREGGLPAWVEPQAFAEFFPVTEAEAIAALGKPGYRIMRIDDARAFRDALNALLAGGTN